MLQDLFEAFDNTILDAIPQYILLSTQTIGKFVTNKYTYIFSEKHPTSIFFRLEQYKNKINYKLMTSHKLCDVT
jgi:hypothetical protein